MPANKSDFLENATINHFLRNSAQAAPANHFVDLSTTVINEDGSGATPPTGGYARIAVTMGAPSNGVSSNTAEVLFGPATSNWGTITHFRIMDALTGGNQLYQGPLTASVVVNNGDSARFTVGQLQVTET